MPRRPWRRGRDDGYVIHPREMQVTSWWQPTSPEAKRIARTGGLELPSEEVGLRERLGADLSDKSLRFYGGAPGLSPGDPLLPRIGLAPIPFPSLDTVPLSPLLRNAWVAASEWFGGGDVYEVEPLGEPVRLRAELRYRAARVVRVLATGVQWDDAPERNGVPPPSVPSPPFFHGGVTGLDPGDRILPQYWTNPRSLVEGAKGVWVAPDPAISWQYAFRFPEGDVYQVLPEGAMLGSAEGEAIFEAAVVVAVVARGVDREAPKTANGRGRRTWG
jgi:hypothetical protein